MRHVTPGAITTDPLHDGVKVEDYLLHSTFLFFIFLIEDWIYVYFSLPTAFCVRTRHRHERDVATPPAVVGGVWARKEPNARRRRSLPETTASSARSSV